MKMAPRAALLISAASTAKGAEQLLAARAVGLWPIDTQVSVTTQSAPRTAFDGIVVQSDDGALLALDPVDDAVLRGAAASGRRACSSKPKRAAACIHETATLLPSPTQATVRPLIGPFSSSNVMMSAMTWQGWLLSVRPLMTGIGGVPRQLEQRRVLVGADHDGVDVAREHARGIGDGLAAAELQSRCG